MHRATVSHRTLKSSVQATFWELSCRGGPLNFAIRISRASVGVAVSLGVCQQGCEFMLCHYFMPQKTLKLKLQGQS